MSWKDSFDRAKRKQAQSDVVRPKEDQPDPRSAKTKPASIQDIRAQNFKNFKSTKNHTAVPVIIGRYPVFEPVKTGRRVFHKEWTPLHPFHRIKEDDNIEIWKRFKTLNQHDCTVYLILRQNVDAEFVAAMTRYEILKKMGLRTQGANYKYIEDAIDRLLGTQFKVRYLEEYINKGSLVQNVAEEESSNAYVIQLSRALNAFLQIDHWAKVSIRQRLALGQNQLAQSLHLYLSVNQCPKGGKWFSWERDLWAIWGKNYKEKSPFVWKFKRNAIKPLVDMGFIQKAKENRNKSAIRLVW